MKLREAQTLAETAMRAHGLDGWTFSFNRRKNSFGLTNYTRSMIQLSAILTEHGTREQVTQTIGHEIAHALCGEGTGHGPVWKAQMRSMGLVPDRCGDASEQQEQVLRSTAKYVLSCSVTGRVIAHKNRIVKERRLKDGRLRRYGGHTCKCHYKEVLYNGMTFDMI